MANQNKQNSAQNQQSSSSKSQNQSQERKQPQSSGQSQSGRSQGGKIDNVLYDVVTVLHEKSKGLEAYDKYMQDMQGNQEVRAIFEEIRRNDEEAVQRLEECLRLLVGKGGESGAEASGESEDEEAA